jgi:hypothetical protein
LTRTGFTPGVALSSALIGFRLPAFAISVSRRFSVTPTRTEKSPALDGVGRIGEN